MDTEDQLLITLATAPASDSWGFVGVVAVGDHEAYRTIRAYMSPGEALGATQRLLADVLGTLMAGQEWGNAQSEFGDTFRARTELEFGLRGKATHAVGQPTRDDDAPLPATWHWALRWARQRGLVRDQAPLSPTA